MSIINEEKVLVSYKEHKYLNTPACKPFYVFKLTYSKIYIAMDSASRCH